MESLFTLLKSNHEPTTAEREELTTSYRTPIAKLQRLDDDLHQLEDHINELKRERGLLKTSIDQHYNLLSPFRCLPDDILHEIFLWCLPTAHESLLDVSEPPLLLGYVCKRWRTIAYQTPTLWASLHIVIPISSGRRQQYHSSSPEQFRLDVKNHQDGISRWISRSCQVPLSISFPRSISYPTSLSYPISLSYLDLVLSFSARLHHLEVDSFSTPISQKLASLPASDFPNLRTLVLKFDRTHSSNQVEWKSSGLLSAPNLSGLRIFSFKSQIRSVNLNWARITRLDLVSKRSQRTDFDDARKILASCPRLTHFSLVVHETGNTESVEYEPLSLSHLHTLIVVDYATNFGSLFRGANIPALRHLTYHNMHRPSFDRPSTLLCILSQTPMCLERLTTNVQFLTHSDFLSCLKLLPRLTHLCNVRPPARISREQVTYIELYPMAPKILTVVLEILTPRAGLPLYLPALQCLHIDLNNLRMEVTDQNLLEFIERRMDFGPPVASLAEVRFISEQSMQMDIEVPLSRYTRNGLKLHLKYREDSPSILSTSPIPFFYPSYGIERFEVQADYCF